LGKIRDPETGALLDHALAAWFPGPWSFTGEDSGEIQGHGGGTLPRLVLELVLRSGARLARPGEFTERAFLNGRLSLDQAEAVAEIVASESEAEAKIAARALDGALKERVAPIFESLKGALARLTGILDFEEDWTERDCRWLTRELGALEESLRELIELRKSGRMWREGVKVVLAGLPNAGKSELFNALLGKRRALVSSIPGTTRDYITAVLEWGRVRVELVDTAGLREEADGELERMGQDLALEQLGEADLIIWLHDLAAPEVVPPPRFPGGAQVIEVWNKADLMHPDHPLAQPPGLRVSALRRSGLDKLRGEVLKRAGVSGGAVPDLVPNIRQQMALEKSRACLSEALRTLSEGEAPEIAGIILRSSLDHLGCVCGRVFTEDLLAEVFRHFCLGK
jgi:tRNA modification GTPase